MSQGLGIEALRRMRSTRRRRYVEQLDVMEVLYRVYLGLIFGAIGLGVLGGLIHEAPATPDAIQWMRDHLAAAVGLALAAGVFGGLRMGAHGGPLAIEAGDVQYALLAPVDRAAALRPLALRQLRTGALVGAVAGAVLGNFVFRRLPGSPVEWIACLGAFGALIPVTVLGAALVASGRRLRPAAAVVIGFALIAWSAADLFLGATTSPATMLGELAVLPLQSGVAAALAVPGAVLALGLAATGLLGVGSILLEAARRRAALAAQLRFSASVQDLRTVVLLRRQLASERPRRRPWLRMGSGWWSSHPVWRRGWQSFLRWPPVRIVRVLLIAGFAGGIALGAWSSAAPALLLPGVLLFVAALDLVEPLAQESDHPTRRRLLPHDPNKLITRHLAAPAVALAAVILVAAVAAALGGGGLTAIEVGLVVCAPLGFVLACSAAYSATTNPYAFLLNPQAGYAVAAAPPVAASVLVAIPLLVAHAAERHGSSALGAAFSGSVFVAIVGAIAAALLGSWLAKGQPVTA